MTDKAGSRTKHGPRMAEHVLSALNGSFGDYLSQTDNGLQQPMAFYRDARPVAPEDLAPPPTGKVCVLVHGLCCNESLWRFPSPHEGGDYGELLERRCGYMPLYLRFNTGLRISDNGEQLAALLERFCVHHGAAVTELLLSATAWAAWSSAAAATSAAKRAIPGCGVCVTPCVGGAIAMVDGKLEKAPKLSKAVAEKGWLVECAQPYDRPPPWETRTPAWEGRGARPALAAGGPVRALCRR